jgi:hypothetical protein
MASQVQPAFDTCHTYLVIEQQRKDMGVSVCSPRHVHLLGVRLIGAALVKSREESLGPCI